MSRLDFKNTGCFGSGRKFGHFFAETEILPKPLLLAETETEIESSVRYYYKVCTREVLLSR